MRDVVAQSNVLSTSLSFESISETVVPMLTDILTMKGLVNSSWVSGKTELKNVVGKVFPDS